MRTSGYRKCYFYMTLRYGLMLWAYLKLITASALLGILIMLIYKAIMVYIHFSIFGTEEILYSGLFFILITDIILNSIFIVGAYKFLNRTRTHKLGTIEKKFMRKCFIFNVILWTMCVLMGMLSIILVVHTLLDLSWFKFYMAKLVTIGTTSFIYVVVQTYYLLLMRNEAVNGNDTGNLVLVQDAV